MSKIINVIGFFALILSHFNNVGARLVTDTIFRILNETDNNVYVHVSLARQKVSVKEKMRLYKLIKHINEKFYEQKSI